MTEREMEDLVWEHPEKFLNEPLTQFQRQPASGVGRADLIFLDRIGRVLVIELKRGTLERGAVPQIVDYFGMLKSRFPNKSVELMIIANSIPPERRLSCEQFHIVPV
jgi:RecB family endonuclease NucS